MSRHPRLAIIRLSWNNTFAPRGVFTKSFARRWTFCAGVLFLGTLEKAEKSDVTITRPAPSSVIYELHVMYWLCPIMSLNDYDYLCDVTFWKKQVKHWNMCACKVFHVHVQKSFWFLSVWQSFSWTLPTVICGGTYMDGTYPSGLCACCRPFTVIMSRRAAC
jgi:hypothetical protein